MGLFKRITGSWRRSKERATNAKDERRVQEFEAEQETRARVAPEPAPLDPYRDQVGQGPYTGTNPF
jgi:hypothetical protein